MYVLLVLSDGFEALFLQEERKELSSFPSWVFRGRKVPLESNLHLSWRKAITFSYWSFSHLFSRVGPFFLYPSYITVRGKEAIHILFFLLTKSSFSLFPPWPFVFGTFFVAGFANNISWEAPFLRTQTSLLNLEIRQKVPIFSLSPSISLPFLSPKAP